MKNLKLSLITICGFIFFFLLTEQIKAQYTQYCPNPFNIDTKIFVMFQSEGRGHETDWDAEDMKCILTNEEVLNEIKKRFSTKVSFVGTTKPVSIRSALEIFNQEKDIDGILVFGPPTNELIKTGLPIISVFRLWQTWLDRFRFQEYKGEKIIFDCVPMVRDREESVFSARMDGLARKIRIIQAISQMNYRILVIDDRPNLNVGSIGIISNLDESNKYDKTTKDNISEIFGGEIVKIPILELWNKIKEIEEQEAKNVANKWINEAYALVNTNEACVLGSAKTYLAQKALRDKYDCDAVIYYDYEGNKYKLGEIYSGCMGATQFGNEGIMTTAQSMVDCMLAQQVGYYMTGRGGFNGDLAIDSFLELAFVNHCECPLNMLGDNSKNCTYHIRNLPYWEKNKGGVGVQVDLPINETVTAVEMNFEEKKMAIFTGKTEARPEEYFSEMNWPGIDCRTRAAIKTNTKALLENIDNWPHRFIPFHHKVIFFGDYRDDFENLAKLIGFEFIEEDKEN